MRKAFQTKKTQKIDEKWLTIMHPNFEGVQGEVLVSFELLTQGTGSLRILHDALHTMYYLFFFTRDSAESEKFPNGLGRKSPNQYPELEEPVRPGLKP